MTLVTGKGGRYKYYKCSRRQNQGNHACTSGNLSMEKLDIQVLNHLINRVFTTERLQVMLIELRKRRESAQAQQQARINELNRQIKNAEDRQQRLLDAIENGVIDLDEVTQRRAQQNKAAREALLIGLVGARRQCAPPADG